jgi:flagellar biosynthesis protein
VAEPRKRAVALKYDPTTAGAPKVVAKATGYAADRLLAIARANGVPIRDDPALVSVLSRLKIDQEIPPQLYRAVAAILAFLHNANRG